MKNLDEFTEKYGLIIIIIIAICAFIFVEHTKKNSQNFREYLKFNGGLAIGEFTDRSFSTSLGNVSSIGYKFIIDSRQIKGGDSRCYQDSPKSSDVFENSKLAKTGDKFLVLYDLKNPIRSIIRLDYPIKDSSDFKRYIQEFEELRRKR